MPRILVSGASGLIGSGLIPRLIAAGHSVVRLVRRQPEAGEIGWDPGRGQIDRKALEGIDAAVHLSGENIGAGRFTAARKERILRSRTDSTRLLAETLASLRPKPQALICASAIGFYGNRGDEALDEASTAGEGFLAEVCRAWETAADVARDAELRVCHLRVGIVLTPRGGALQKLLTPVRLGLAGPIGGGRQVMSWIGYQDIVGAFERLVEDEALEGPFNGTAPHPVTNAQFIATLGRLLHRPTALPLPAFAIKLALGEMGQALLLEGARVLPRRLLEVGFSFAHPTLEEALRFELTRASPTADLARSSERPLG